MYAVFLSSLRTCQMLRVGVDNTSLIAHCVTFEFGALAMRFVFPALFESHLGSPSFHFELAIPLTRKASQSPQVTLSGTPDVNVFVSTSFRLCHVFNLKRSENSPDQ